MTAGIYNNMVVTGRTPAWHRLGKTVPEPLPIRETIGLTGGQLPIIEKRRLMWGDGTESPWYGLGRIAPLGMVEEAFAPVSEQYRLVTPQDFVTAWEIGTDNAAVETFGVLDGGSIMFISHKLPNSAVRGEEVNRYAIASNFMDGKTANGYTVSQICPVCKNTLMAALGNSAAVFKVNHNSDVINEMVGWLRDCFQTAYERAAAVQEAMDLLAQHHMTGEETDRVLVAAVREPTQPRESGSPEYDRRRLEAWEQGVEAARVERSVIRGLFAGAGVGMEMPGRAGTGFGLYNALAEAYEYVLPGKSATTVARSFMFGTRAGAVQRGFSTLMEICKN
jgi:hypothetical protein